MLRKRFLLVLSFGLMLILIFPIFNSLYNSGVDPKPLASAAIKLYLHKSDIEPISTAPETYLVKHTDGIDPFVSLMENRGWHYDDQMGAEIVFVKSGQMLTAVTQTYSRYFMIISIPQTYAVSASSSKEIITLTATGDILMHKPVIDSGLRSNSYNYDHLYAPVKQLIEAGDYASVNLEAALAGPATGYTGYPVFNSPDSIADGLKNSGFDLVVTASNHSLDRGYQGAMRTIDVLRNAGLDTTGTYKSAEEKNNFFIKDIRGVKVGYLAYSYDTNGIPLPKDKPWFYNLLDRDKILADIAALRPKVDVLVLVLHWGVEYSPYPTEQQRKLAKEFFAKGADVILGSHPHVIQPMETMQINGKEKFVIYSMGNSMGNQNEVERNSGVILNLQFTKDITSGETNLSGISYTPTFIHPCYQNGSRTYRVVPIEETIKAIKEGKDPYLGTDSIPLLEQVLAATTKHLSQPLD